MFPSYWSYMQLTPKAIYSLFLYYFVIWGGVTIIGAQGLFLVLHSGVTPTDVQGTTGCSGLNLDQLRASHIPYMQFYCSGSATFFLWTFFFFTTISIFSSISSTCFILCLSNLIPEVSSKLETLGYWIHIHNWTSIDYYRDLAFFLFHNSPSWLSIQQRSDSKFWNWVVCQRANFTLECATE